MRVRRSSMKRQHKGALLYLILWSSIVACSRAAEPVPLPGPLRDHLKDERFQLVTSIRGMPLGVRAELEKLFGSDELDIAEIGAKFEKSGVSSEPRLPIRQLVAAGCSYDHCLVYYERGGSARSWRVALIHWAPEASRFDWGGVAPAGLKTIDDVQRAILSGAIQGPAGLW
jgi:hypothetical protein